MALQMTWKPSLLNQKRKSGPPLGLRNLGNTCYLNSVLQCLTYTPPLANFCLKFQHSSSCDLAKERDKKSGCPFCILEKRIARSLSTDITLDTPAKINSCLKIFAEHFKFGRQEDAHEFLRYVIDACHNASLRLKKLQQHRGKGGSLSNGADSLSSNGNTVVKDIFGGALQSQVKCLSCGNESNKVDEIMDISLDVLHSGSLKEALHKFFQPEVLDGNNKYKCDNCKKLVSARKQMSVLQAPNVLVIQLKRFEGVFGGKIDKAIAFEEVLVLPSYMCKESQDPYPEYNLFGTIVHSGFSPDSGHYYAYIKDAVGRWYCCNDSYVTLSNLQEVLSEKVYILFFIRTKQRSGSANSASITNRVKSHHACFSGDASKSTCSPVKSMNGKQFLNRHTGKDYSISSTVDKVPSNPQVKLGTVGNTGSKKNPSNVRFKIVVDKWKSIGKCNNVKVSTSVEKHEENISSFTDQNGVHKVKSANGSNSEKGTASPLSNGNRRYQASNGNSVEADSCLTDIRDSGAAGGGFNSQGLQNGSLSCICNNFGSKRKLQIGDLCVLPAKDYQSCAQLEKLKQDFQKEAYLVLQSCGWTDEVYSFMRSRKKLCARELGIDASNMKRMLISDAKSIFIQQIPDSLKKSLIEHLKSFSQEKQGPTSGLMDHSKRVC